MTYVQDPPNVVKVEVTFGCNLRCHFCGLRNLKVKGYQHMDAEVAELIAEGMDDNKFNSRVAIGGRGEPSAHPHLIDLVRIFSPWQTVITTNGWKLTPDYVEELFDAGLSFLALDDYDHSDSVKKLLPKLARPFHYYPDEPQWSPYHKHPKNTQAIVVYRDISKYTGTNMPRGWLDNMCGTALPLELPSPRRRCALPFREMTFAHDGTMMLCCNDFRIEYPVGNILNTSMYNLWNSRELHAMRKCLYDNQRTHRPCYGCNARSYRVGLLPDRNGMMFLPPPTLEDEKIIQEVISRGPMNDGILCSGKVSEQT